MYLAIGTSWAILSGFITQQAHAWIQSTLRHTAVQFEYLPHTRNIYQGQ